MTTGETEEIRTPFQYIGGAEIVRQIVDRFYDLMDSEPEFARLRALHASDLTPMRASLAGFLNAWLGGPQDWFVERPGACVMSAHADIAIDQDTARQWVDAMRRAILDGPVDPAFGEQMADALAAMAQSMGKRSARSAAA